MNELFIMKNTLKIYLGAVTCNLVQVINNDEDYTKEIRLAELKASLESAINDIEELIKGDKNVWRFAH